MLNWPDATKTASASNPKINLLSEGVVNYNNQQPQGQIPQQQQYMVDYKAMNREKRNTNWKLFGILAVAVCFGVGYAVIISTSMVPKSDEHAMSWITNKWSNAQCFKPDDPSLAYYNTSQYFGYSQENVCSFTYPNETWEILPAWYSCCEPDTCSNAFNYTTLVQNAGTPCRHALAVITKGSCHPLGAEFTPSDNDIRVQSSVNKTNGVYICALYCKQIWDNCKDATWSVGGEGIDSIFSDEMDFCENGLGVNVRSEIFTDQCLDDAYSCFNLYVFILLMIFGVLSV